MAAHSPEELAAFQDGEVRLLFARHKETDELVYLEDNTARVQRAFTKASLRCPVRECPTPGLTTAGRTSKRDGYMHLAGGGHAAEGIFHIQGCEMIARWLRAKYPAPGYRVQKEERSNAAGERRADVMVTNLASGARIAFEIQYASLSADKWQERHESYAAQGIPDVWLFGHAGAQLHVDKRNQDQVRLSPTHEAVVESGLPLLWMNPFTGQLGTAVSQGRTGSETVDLPTDTGSGRLILSAMNDFHLVVTGLTSKLLAKLAFNRQAHAVHQKELAHREALRQERIAHEEAIAAQRAEARKRDQEQRRHRARLIAEGLEAAWRETIAYKSVLEKFDGQGPTFLNVEITCGPGIPRPNGQWQSALFNEFWEGRPTGSVISASACAAFLAIPRIAKTDVAEMVTEWLRALVEARYALAHQKARWGEALALEFTVAWNPSARELEVMAEVNVPKPPPTAIERRISELETSLRQAAARMSFEELLKQRMAEYDRIRNKGFGSPVPGEALL